MYLYALIIYQMCSVHTINNSKQISFKDIFIVNPLYSQRRNKCKRKHQNRNSTFLVSLLTLLIKNWNYQFNFSMFYSLLWKYSMECSLLLLWKRETTNITTKITNKKSNHRNWASLELFIVLMVT